jgi:site-specific DNA-methyltransferase (adenine-specific)
MEKEKYNIIYVDPPWRYTENWGNGAVKHHYDTMSFDELKDLKVNDLANENCHLYLWVTNPFIQEGLELIKAWGFEYKQIITWVKTKNGKAMMGLGYYFRVCTEHCIFAVKGKLPRLDKSIKNIIFSPQTKHSAKPPEFRKIIIKHSGDLPRIELFAREKIEGWDAWGNEVPNETQRLIRTKGGSE